MSLKATSRLRLPVAVGTLAVTLAAFTVAVAASDSGVHRLSFGLFITGDSATDVERTYNSVIADVERSGLELDVRKHVISNNCEGAARGMPVDVRRCDGVAWVATARGGATSESMGMLTDAAAPLREHAVVLETVDVHDAAYEALAIAAGVASAMLVGCMMYWNRVAGLECLWTLLTIAFAGTAFLVPYCFILNAIADMSRTSLLA